MKKIISLLLSAVLVLSCCGASALAAAEPCGCGYTPRVHVTGMGTPLYRTLPDGTREQIFPVSGDAVKRAVTASNVGLLAKYLLTGNTDAAVEAVEKIGSQIIGSWQVNEDGSIPEDTAILPETSALPVITSHGEGSHWSFEYDWRRDPLETADDLNAFIDSVLEQTGHDKVDIECFSMGTVMTMAYLSKYGDSKVGKLIISFGALNGISSASEPFGGQVATDKTQITRFILDALGYDPTQMLVKELILAIDALGITGLAAGWAQKLVDSTMDAVYKSAFTKVFATLPGLWSLVADKDYETAKDLLLEYDGETAAKYARLIERIDAYHYGVQTGNEERIKTMAANGHNVYVVAGYGRQMVPVTGTKDITSDSVIDTRYAGCGVTCAPLNTPFPADYVQKVNDGHDHISPDRQLDASTCWLPENTWFIKGIQHSRGCDWYGALCDKLFSTDEYVTVRSDPEYPQFVQFHYTTGKVTTGFTSANEQLTAIPDKVTELFGENGFFTRIVRFLTAVANAVKHALAAPFKALRDKI